MTKIIAYTYSAAIHCPDCTLANFVHSDYSLNRDENGVPEGAVDHEGNPVHPVFNTDEMGSGQVPYHEYCDDCGACVWEA